MRSPLRVLLERQLGTGVVSAERVGRLLITWVGEPAQLWGQPVNTSGALTVHQITCPPAASWHSFMWRYRYGTVPDGRGERRISGQMLNPAGHTCYIVGTVHNGCVLDARLTVEIAREYDGTLPSYATILWLRGQRSSLNARMTNLRQFRDAVAALYTWRSGSLLLRQATRLELMRLYLSRTLPPAVLRAGEE